MVRRLYVLLFAAVFASVALSTAALAKPASNVKVTTVVEVVSGADGQIDWTKGKISAKGLGVAPKGTSGAQAKILAREAAIVVAERNLVKIVQGIHIDSETTVRNAMIESDDISRQVSGFIKGASVTRERELQDGAYEVVMTLDMYGEAESLAQAVDVEKHLTITPVQDDSGSDIASAPVTPDDQQAKPALVEPADEPAEHISSSKVYTGLIIDCRGLGLSRSMCPKILDNTGQEVWGTVKCDPDLVIEKGIVGYYKSLEQARSMGRVGKDPLVIKATGKGGPKSFPSDPIISQASAARLIAEDARFHFLDKLAVGFLVD